MSASPPSDLVRSEPLPRPVRYAAMAVIAVCHLYLLAHSQEPLRLNVGDPWSDANVLTAIKYTKQYGFLETSFTDVLDVGPLTQESYRYTHYPPLAEIIYGAAHRYLGMDSIGSFRLIAIGFSALAMGLLFLYVRRLYGESIALLATMLWSCNLLWLMYADSIHQAPVMQASAFLGLWGLVNGLDDGRRRYWGAAWIGCFACFLTSYDYWIFLPMAVLVTVGVRRGNPLRPANLKPVVLCASACVAAIVLKLVFVAGAVGWRETMADLHFQFLERSTAKYEISAPFPVLIRRATMVFSPLIWVVVLIVLGRLLRKPSWRAFVGHGGWLLVAALLFFGVLSQLSTGQMLPSQVALPFHSICTAMLVIELFKGGVRSRVLGVAILVVAPLWSAVWLARHPRAFLAESDIAKVAAYLREHDSNDFLASNLISVGPIQAYFDRHYWPTYYSETGSVPEATSHQDALDLMARSGRDHYHVLFFSDPSSRMIDKSLWQIGAPKRQWSVAGWPYFFRTKSVGMIQQIDDTILRNLRAVGATSVVVTDDITLFRVTKQGVLAAAYSHLPDRSFIDLGSTTADLHKLLGWSRGAWHRDDWVAGATVVGRDECARPGDKRCRTVLTKRGGVRRGQEFVRAADLLVRASGGCALDVLAESTRPGAFTLLLNGAKPLAESADSRRRTARFAAESVEDGMNIVTFQSSAAARSSAPTVSSVELRRVCETQ